MKFFPMHMHLHASHEPTASISSHMEWSRRLGIRHIWITEHDSRIGKKKKPLDSFSFSEPKLYYTLPSGIKAGFIEDECNTGRYLFENSSENYFLSLIAKRGEREAMTFKSSGKNHSEPLFSNLSVELFADFFVSGGASVKVEMILSERPPSFSHARLVYYLGNAPSETPENTQYLPFPKCEEGKYIFNLSKDAGESVGGLDNALCYIKITLLGGAGEAKCLFKKISFFRQMNANEAREAQKRLAAELSSKFGVEAFVGFEITEAGKAGRHKNCFSTTVPVIDYDKSGFNVTEEEAAEHVLSHGGIFSYNHPLSELRGGTLSGEEKIAATENFAAELISNRLFGASVIEVGFPEGRDGFDYTHFAMLWDKLSLAGIFITADGDSDNHGASEDGWLLGNNFATYIGLFEDETPCEENIIKALLRGSVYAADPVKNVKLDLHSGCAPMGSVIVGKSARVDFSVSSLSEPVSCSVIINGDVCEIFDINSSEADFSFTLSVEQKYNFLRVELRDKRGRLVALTNPIYLVSSENYIPKNANIRKAKC